MRHTRFISIAAALLALISIPITRPAAGADGPNAPIALKVGEDVSVDFKGAGDALAALEWSERTEFQRDILLNAAFAAFPSSPEQRQDFAAAYGALRRPYLEALAPGEVGQGRYAALSKDAAVVLVPFTARGKSFDLAAVYRLLDKQMCLAGKLPDNIHVVAYRLTQFPADAASGTITLLETIPTKQFYTDGKHGYVEAQIAEAADLGKFLENTDDLISVRVAGDKLTVSGRKYPDATFKMKVRDRITLDDLKVLWNAFHDDKAAVEKMAAKIKERLKDPDLTDEQLTRLARLQLARMGDQESELGFSLDPWIDLKKLQKGLEDLLDDDDLLKDLGAKHAKRLKGCADRVAEMLKDQAAQPGGAHPVTEVPSSRRDDRSGLFEFKDEVSRDLEKAPNNKELKLLVEVLEGLTHEAQFVRARYEGVLPGTPVAMSMYYCDLIAKAYAFGQINRDPIRNLPRVDGFESWPQIRLGGQYWEEIRTAHNLRLWWSADTGGFRWNKGPKQTEIAFGPQAVRISFRNKVGEIAEEQEPDPLRALFRDRWNRHYLDIADQDCIFHHFNQIYKWATAIKAFDTIGRANPLKVAEGKPERTNLRFDTWYQDAIKQKKVSFQVKFDFTKRYKGVAEETMGFVQSGVYSEAGAVKNWVGGGDLGPTGRDIKSAERGVAQPRLPGQDFVLPSGRKIVVPGEGRERVAVVPAESAKRDAPAVRFHLPRGRLESEFTVQPETTTLRNWVYDGTGSRDGSQLATKMVDGRVVVEWTSGTYDRAFAATRAISTGRDLDPRQVAEVRYTETGDRMLLKLAGDKDTWVEVVPGGNGKKPPTGAMAVGSPGESGWFYNVVRTELTPAELAAYRPAAGKGYVRIELTGQVASPYRLESDWFPKAGPSGSASVFGKGVTGDAVKAALLDLPVRESRYVSLLLETVANPTRGRETAGDVRFDLQKDRQDAAFDLFARAIERGAVPEEVRLGSGKEQLIIGRQGDFYTLSREAGGNSLLPAESPFRYVLTESETAGRRGVRVLERTLILPEKATAATRKTAAEVADFLSKNPDLTAAAAHVDNLNVNALKELQTRYDALGKSAVLEWNADATALTLKDANVTVTRKELIAWSNDTAELPAGVLDALKKQPLVIKELPAQDLHSGNSQFGGALRKLQEKGVQITYKLSATPADAMPARLKELMNYTELDFEAESGQLGKITNKQVADFAVRYLKSQSPGEVIDEGRGSVRVIVDHAENKLTMPELTTRAKAGLYKDRHVVLGVCNDKPADIAAFCEAAYANGCRSVVIPSGKVSVPIVLLTTAVLRADPAYRSGKIPREAWKNAEDAVLEKLSEVLKDSGWDTAATPAAKATADAEVLKLLDRMIPDFRPSPMFRDQRGTPNEAGAQIKQFIEDSKRNSWNQTTSRPHSPAEKAGAAA